MHTTGHLFVILVMLSNQPKKSLNNIFAAKLKDREAVSTSAARISVGRHMKVRHGYRISGV